ncbi:OmpA family protein [Mucilaginibacter gotjawali]|uniref:Outer membrane porin F n=2 Tax=Mucilaginibacter gotjawali TaxID=1550579 RepID=A0A0X8X641_9SPHI|nr:OmpA family protein [Mucilaginibacter gotjawali]MBB3055098.1 OOP family OmpA-OmpF porin [Mucilaginibacter gotjawali]BAU56284.1 Outer membrane porin F precursor [Mucilaginibacter gotjawali]
MNYSTLKKTVVLSFVSLMAVGMAKAQTTPADSSKTSSGTGTAKVFGGASQYNTFSIGINIGATSPSVFTGGANPFPKSKADLGYGLSLRDQLSHAFSLQLDAHGGTLKGDAGSGTVTDLKGMKWSSFSTKFWSGSLSGVINVGNVSFLHRANAVNFYVSGGAGLAFYKPDPIDANGVDHNYNKTVKELIVPIGAGVKFKLSDQLDLNLGYTENFTDGINLSGVHAAFPQAITNKYSYGYAGLEYTFGPKSKPSLEWANPVAMMYDELYDAALRQEVEALKGRVANVETAVNGLKKDSDGDGVSDQFDKCPNTPAGTVVDGSGCPLPPPVDTSLFMRKGQISGPATSAAAYSNIQFEFDSSVLKTSSYPILDATSADLRSSGASAELDGYASSEGTAAHNMRLSKDRANSVKTYLVNSGVPAKKLKVKGFGETHPIADNSTEAGRIANRRVEFHKK